MTFQVPGLEDWMRRYYFRTKIDIGSSGVQDYTFAEVRDIAGISARDLDDVLLCDAPTTGSSEVRQALANRYGHADPGEVMTTHGASEAIFLSLETVLSPGDEVITLDPTYHSHVSIPRQIGCRLRSWDVVHGTEMFVDLNSLRGLMTTRVNAILVNFPHNPTGVTISPSEVHELVAIAADADAYLLWDASFAELVYGNPMLPDPVSLYDKAISVGTFSKAYGLPGLRFGWCVADRNIINRMIGLRDTMTICLSPLVEYIAARVVESADKFISPRLRQARKNLSELTTWMQQHSDEVDFVAPSGGVTAFPHFRTVADCETMCRDLAERSQTLLVPGSAFGHRNCVRLGFGGASSELTAGLKHLSRYLKDYAKPQ
jgi:capreomycidine synthase